MFESDDLEPFVKILQRYSVSRWAQWVDEENMTLVDVAEDEGSERCLYHMQQCLLRLVPPDGAGPYRIVLDETAVGPTAELGDIILELHTGTVVEVLEVVVLEKEQRVRGRLADPPGWISLMNMETGRRRRGVHSCDACSRSASARPPSGLHESAQVQPTPSHQGFGSHRHARLCSVCFACGVG